jgi:NADH-quinone oxidoreductase subunit L
MPILDHLWIILALPLAGSAINGLLGKRWPQKAVNSVAIGSVALTFLCVVELIREFAQLPASQIPYFGRYFNWMVAGNFKVDFALQVDQLTMVMLLVVSFVGLLIHIYSTGYMAHEGGYYRFFGYLNLFMFSMLMLVLANNMLVMFVGWEGVGTCSYLLIGFYFHKKSASDAGKKAFIVNRIGDAGFLLGIFMTSALLGTINFNEIGKALESVLATGDPQVVHHAITAIALLLFVGAAGKSAQIPLYVWLPDAMEGPTPVSALIHAATMVTAGVYMVTRMNHVYQLSPTAMEVVGVTGAITAIYAASMGVVQNDIKKVLAYSTVSQLGYMFLACGVGAFTAGIFHLMTHAFFKGLLFLAAGSVIHALSGEQDMRKMGALSKKIPVTYWTMLIATLAIAGIFPFAGFMSKDLILGRTYERDVMLWIIGYFTAGMTAFYMFRLIFMTFHGHSRVDHEVEHHIHESPRSMLIPLVILAVLSVTGGWLSWPEILGGNSRFIHFLEPIIAVPNLGRAEATKGPGSPMGEIILMLLSEGLVVLGILFAWYIYLKRIDLPAKIAKSLNGFYDLVYHKYYVDELYDAMFVNRAKDLGLALGAFDRTVVDGLGVNGAGWLTRAISRLSMWWDTWIVDGSVRLGSRIIWILSFPVRMIQDGSMQHYMLLIVIGLLGFMAYYFHVAHAALH